MSLDLFLQFRMHAMQKAWSHPVIKPNRFPLLAIISRHIPHSAFCDAACTSCGKLEKRTDFCSHILRCWVAMFLLCGCRHLDLQWGHGRPCARLQYSPYLHEPVIWYRHSTISSEEEPAWENRQASPLLHAPLRKKTHVGCSPLFDMAGMWRWRGEYS